MLELLATNSVVTVNQVAVHAQMNEYAQYEQQKHVKSNKRVNCAQGADE